MDIHKWHQLEEDAQEKEKITESGEYDWVGNVECEGMGVDAVESGGMRVDVEDSKEGMVIGDECKDGISDAECKDMDTGTVKGLGVSYEINLLA
jgi:hypothetical protein